MSAGNDPQPIAMQCPDADALRQFIQGGLAADAQDAIARHIETCTPCGELIQRAKFGDDPGRLVQEESGGNVPPDVSPYATVDTTLPESEVAKDLTVGSRTFAGLARSRQIGRYRIVSKLGQGGMGTVYKAQHTKLGKTVALKMLSSERTRDPLAVARLRREMQAVGALSHPNIVGAHDADEIDGVHFLVLEYVAGFDLSSVVGHCGPLDVADACEVVRQAAVGLDYAHRQGLVHRDVKPSNLMLTPEGVVKVVDLGLALLVEGGGRDELTGAHAMMGSLDYMAPEQFNDSHRVDARADLYALGCTLCRLLTGRTPFVGPQYSSPLQKMMGHASHDPPTLSTQRGDVSAELAGLVLRLLAKRPDERFTTAAELATALEPFCRESRLTELYRRSEAALAPSADASVAEIAPIKIDDFPQWPLDGAHVHAIDDTLRGAQGRPRGYRRVILTVAGMVLLLGAVGYWNHRAEDLRQAASDRSPQTAEIIGVDPAGRSTPPLVVAPFSADEARRHQQAWADYLATQVEVLNSMGSKMVLIPPGEFLMGSTLEQIDAAIRMTVETNPGPIPMNLHYDEVPQHRVVISRPLRFGVSEVTVGEFQQFVEAAQYVTEAERYGFGNSPLVANADATASTKGRSWLEPGLTPHGGYVMPVTQVTWNDAIAYCRWLSEREGIVYRLPTEAEWEWACRAGTTTPFYFGDDPALASDHAWYTSADKRGRLGRGGLKLPNPFGLHDLHGNLEEWCADFFEEGWYSRSASIDPRGPALGARRVVRGGNWLRTLNYCRSAARSGREPTLRDNHTGFRIVSEFAELKAADVSPVGGT